MMTADVRAAATTPVVLLEWFAIVPFTVGANPPAAVTPLQQIPNARPKDASEEAGQAGADAR
jgi:hypothetical protein